MAFHGDVLGCGLLDGHAQRFVACGYTCLTFRTNLLFLCGKSTCKCKFVRIGVKFCSSTQAITKY